MDFKKKINKYVKDNSKKIIFRDFKNNWSWEQVDKESNKIVESLKKILSKNQISVPITISRRSELLISFIACLKLNISFTPIIKSSENEIKDLLKKLNSTFYFDPLKNKAIMFNNINTNHFKNKSFIKNKIYILFTSGSTGKPKGVICNNENISNTILWSKKYLTWNANDVIGNVTKFNFDISIFDFFTSIYFNIPLVIINKPYDIDETLLNIKRKGVTSIFSTPSFFSQFVFNNSVNKTKKSNLKQIISGGDFFPMKHLENWFYNNQKIKIFNVWGPTETSIVNSMYEIKKNDHQLFNKINSMPVGESTRRMEIKIIKNNKILSGANEKGFIHIAGKSICKGFIEEKNRYKKMIKYINKKKYFNTGDIGYFDNNKKLYILGRIDNDIKIQGYRINQKEIEQVCETFENVFLSSIFKKNITSEFSELQILIQLKKNREFDIFSFKKYLREKLPFYKIPKKVKIINKIPLNSNGKLDRKTIDKLYS